MVPHSPDLHPPVQQMDFDLLPRQVSAFYQAPDLHKCVCVFDQFKYFDINQIITSHLKDIALIALPGRKLTEMGRLHIKRTQAVTAYR